jgi:hypothetical protein
MKNNLTSYDLKRGVFKPVYMYSSRSIASIAAFIASGLFHEWLIYFIFDMHLEEGSHAVTKSALGKQTAFFVWNAVVIVLESIVGNAVIFKWISQTMPKLVVVGLVLCTALPVAHWFLHCYFKSELFVHGELAFPLIRVLEPEISS